MKRILAPLMLIVLTACGVATPTTAKQPTEIEQTAAYLRGELPLISLAVDTCLYLPEGAGALKPEARQRCGW